MLQVQQVADGAGKLGDAGGAQIEQPQAPQAGKHAGGDLLDGASRRGGHRGVLHQEQQSLQALGLVRDLEDLGGHEAADQGQAAAASGGKSSPSGGHRPVLVADDGPREFVEQIVHPIRCLLPAVFVVVVVFLLEEGPELQVGEASVGDVLRGLLGGRHGGPSQALGRPELDELLPVAFGSSEQYSKQLFRWAGRRS